MRIENGLPFESCESCNMCILDVSDRLSVYQNPDTKETFCEKVIYVGCKNEHKCRSNRIKDGIRNAKQ